MSRTWLATKWAAFIVGPSVAMVVIVVNVAMRATQ